MLGNILIAECSSLLSCLPPGMPTTSSPGMQVVSPSMLGYVLTTKCAETYLSQYVCRYFQVWGAAGRRSVASRPGGWETNTSPGLEPISLFSDLVKLPFRVPRFLWEPRGWPTTTSLGMEIVAPPTQHIPTTVILCEPSCSGVCGCWCWLLCWWCLGRMAVWTLAVWRCLICARKVGG